MATTAKARTAPRMPRRRCTRMRCVATRYACTKNNRHHNDIMTPWACSSTGRGGLPNSAFKKYERANPVTAITAQASAPTMYGDRLVRRSDLLSTASCLRSNLYLDAYRGWMIGRVVVFNRLDCMHWFRLHPMFRPVTRVLRRVRALDLSDFIPGLVVANMWRLSTRIPVQKEARPMMMMHGLR